MSTRITNSMLTRSLLSDLNGVSERLATTKQKLTSGKELTRPSDDPFAVSRAIELAGSLEATRQYKRNVGEAMAYQDVTELALSRITDTVQRARELLIQGANGSNGASARDAIASEIEALIDSAKQELNASYGGDFIFGGTATNTQPYAVGGADTYAGNTAGIAREIGPGVSLNVNVIGRDVLGDGVGAGDNKLLHALRDTVAHLRSAAPADQNLLRTTDLQRIDNGLNELTRLRAVVGATTNRLETADSRLAEMEGSTIKLLSETEDVDMAKALIDFSTQQSVYQSALRAGANIVQQSLLDFLR